MTGLYKTEDLYRVFIHDHIDEIMGHAAELEAFEDSDLDSMKGQIIAGISEKKKMVIVPMEEMKELMIKFAAIQFIQDEIEMQ